MIIAFVSHINLIDLTSPKQGAAVQLATIQGIENQVSSRIQDGFNIGLNFGPIS